MACKHWLLNNSYGIPNTTVAIKSQTACSGRRCTNRKDTVTELAFIQVVDYAYTTQAHNNSIVTFKNVCAPECNGSWLKNKQTEGMHSSPAGRSWCSRFYQAATRALKLQIHINPATPQLSIPTRMNTISLSILHSLPAAHMHPQMHVRPSASAARNVSCLFANVSMRNWDGEHTCKTSAC